ncbi:hypothetical protein BGZ54_010093 [Gamsiella multidivaricata]|nr:hypothetical protein BGZ54_010093 [Gamsiella multidivaricata]
MQSIGHDLRRGLNNFSFGNNYKNINKWLGELKNLDSSYKTLDKEITSNAKLISGWGCNEGDDLTDVCQRMTQLMENRKKKHDLTNQIAKHQKSSKENPIKMLELQSAYERVSAELLVQELELLQFKRVTIQDAFNAQLDAMIEFGEKMALIAGYGRQITNVIDVGPQEAHRTALYSGAEYTAAAINQVKVAVTSWQPQPVGNPIRSHVGPSQDELAMSGAAVAYNSRTSPLNSYEESHSPDDELNDHEFHDGVAIDKNSGYWNEVQMLKANPSQTSLNDGHGSDYDNWKQELHGATDRSDDYISPPASNPDASPYIPSQQMNQLQEQQRQLQVEQQRVRQHSHSSYSPKPSPSQQHYQNAASSVATSLRHSSMDNYGSPGGGGGSGRPFTPAMLRRGDTADQYPSSSPSPSYSSYQQQPASYESSLSPAPARGYRLGFADPRERNRTDKMDNSELYKTEFQPTIASRFTRTPMIMDEK